MELLTGDRLIPNASDFPEHISPFPGTGNLLFPNPAPVLHPPDMSGQTMPPQKLRPIRGNCRSPSNPLTSNPFSPSPPDAPEVDGAAFERLGLLGNHQFHLCGVSEYFDQPVAVSGGGAECNSVPDSSFFVESEAGRRDPNPNPEEGFWEDETSSSLNHAGLSVGVNDSLNRKKKKRKTRKRIEEFLENLVMKVMEKQEQMHEHLINMIESRERERISREEAWKEQEIERTKRDEEIRARETSRSLALISYIQNVMGHEIKTPPPSTTITPLVDNGSNGTNSRRWLEAEIQALIMFRTAKEEKFQVRSCNVWDEISAGMRGMGYNRTAKKCKEKWESINKNLKISSGNAGKKQHRNVEELDVVYKNGVVNQEDALRSIKDENGTSSDSRM